MATSSSASTSTSHGNTNTNIYNVFINHRGPDVKEGLATLLYQGLRKKGLGVFLDREEMQAGEKLSTQIEGAIRQASVHLAIFSKGYASSRWCLDELVLMQETNRTIIPIFYGVNPSALRWTQAADGVYARALRKLEERHDSNTINKWRNALFNAAGISGYELSAYNNNEELLVSKEELKKLEEQLVSKVIKRVSEIASKTPLSVAEYPTGLADKLKELQTIVKSAQQQTQNLATAVGIVGLGGIGKTTLAKQFFNSHRSNYVSSCFLMDVRGKVARNDLNSLQVQLIKELAQRNVQINTPDEGIEMLKKHLSSLDRVLIVLDDVDHIDQLDKLFSPGKDTIHSSSLILVTSRNKDVLTSAQIVESSIYMLKGLNQQYSLELFCLHAFNQPYPVIGFQRLVEKFLDACHGLPLSLKVIGALLCGKDLTYWEEQFHKISIVVPTDIQSRLKISYDGLDEEEKQIFLDIACFFIGEKRDTALRIWDGSSWLGRPGLGKLENRCLVELDNENCIKMHDQLRDLGRELAKNSEYPLRLWTLRDSFDDFYNAFQIQRPNSQFIPHLSFCCETHIVSNSFVRGIHTFHTNDAKISFEDLVASCNMSRLQLLRAEGDFVKRLFQVRHSRQSRQLIYLHWDNCPYSSLPTSIPLKNLRVLYIQGGFLKTLWRHESQAPLQLRELVLNAEIRRIPKSIGKLEHLEKFVLTSKCIKTLPDSLGNLRNLQELNLSGCFGLQMLPDSVGNMTNLRELNLSRCSGLQMLPDSVGNMTNLRELNLSRCSGLQMLPDSVGNMTNLRVLYLTSCSGLQMLPDSVGNMTNLQVLYLSGCRRLQMLPDSVGNMTNLQELNLCRCYGLQMLPDSVGNMTNLRVLDLCGCSRLEMLPDSVGNMTNLRVLDLTSYSGLHKLPDSVGNMTNLQELNLSSGSGLQMLPDSVGNMTNLRVLNLSSCSGLQMLPDSVGNMTNLRELYLCRCFGLQMLPDSVGNMTNLRVLDLSGCLRLQMLPDSVGNMTNLNRLCLYGCSNLRSRDVVEQLWRQRRSSCDVVEQLRQRRNFTLIEGIRRPMLNT